MVRVINQYDVLWVNLDSTVGSEIKKVRPCVVLSPNEMNRNINTVIVAPLTSKAKNYPTNVKIRFNDKDGWAVIDQIRCIDKSRLVKLGGSIERESIRLIKNVIREILID